MRLSAAAAAIIRINVAFFADGAARGELQSVLARRGVPPRPHGQVQEEDEFRSSSEAEQTTSVADPAGQGGPYRELTPDSTALVDSTFDSPIARVNVLLPEVVPGEIFAGVKTALEVASILARRTGLPLRIVTLKRVGSSASEDREFAKSVERYLISCGLADGSLTEVVSRSALPGFAFGRDDLWLATHWTTAHSLDVVRRLGLGDLRCFYLIQDYEPGFNPWSTEFALARSTYHAGFALIVNSAPLADYLREGEGLHLAASQVFSPAFDLEELKVAADARMPSDVMRLFFYGRPSKPRNLYRLGISALRILALALTERGIAYEMLMAGENGESVNLGPTILRNLGALSRDEYFALLARTDVGLSLQYSPHPSHPPLDLAISGAQAVTNDFSSGRGSFHPNLHAVPADPDLLASELLRVILALDRKETGRFAPPENDSLGFPLDQVMERALGNR